MLGYLRMSPWRRGPLLLARRPEVFVALVAAAFVATLPAAAAAPFVSSARHGTLHDEIAQSCPSFVADWATTTVPNPPAPTDYSTVGAFRAATSQYDALVASNAARQAAASKAAVGLRPLIRTQLTTATLAGGAQVTVADRPGFESHVALESGPSGSGVWIPATYARDTNLTVGSTIHFQPVEARAGFDIRVAAVYRDLKSAPRTAFWCALMPYWNAQNSFTEQPPPLLLTDSGTFTRALAATAPSAAPVRSHNVFLEWDLPSSQPTIDQATLAVTSVRNVNHALGISATQPAKFDPTAPYVTSDLADMVARAQFAGDSMWPAITPITATGIAIGLSIVAAAAVFWVLRRRQELAVLSAHGMSARSLGVKAIAEALPAITVGAAAGWAVALWLVRTIGPSPIVNATSVRESVAAAAATFIAAVLLMAAVAAARCRSLADEQTVRRLPHIGRLPWELLLIVAAPLIWRSYGASVTTSGNVNGQTSGVIVHIPERLLIVPILAIIGLFAFAGRLWAVAMRRRRTGSNRGVSRYLAGRRAARQAGVAVTLALACALSVCLAVYGAAITGSVRTTLDAKTKFYAGSDVVVTLQKPGPIPAVFAGHATSVVRLNGVQIDGLLTDLIGVNPDTFARGAFWNDQITGQSLADIVKPLRKIGNLATPVVIMAGATQTGDQELDIDAGQPVLFDVGSIDTLPAQHNEFPTALINQALIANAPAALHQIWIRGDVNTILHELTATGLATKFIEVAGDVTVNSVYQPLTFTFEYLTALSLLCGIIAIVGLLLYLESRAPGNRRGYAMLRRMGIGTGQHWRAVLWELGTPLILGLIAGLGSSALAAYGLRHYVDVAPSVPPGGLLTLPVAVMVGISLVVVTVTVAASAYAHLRAVRADPADVLRDAG